MEEQRDERVEEDQEEEGVEDPESALGAAGDEVEDAVDQDDLVHDEQPHCDELLLLRNL